MENSCNIILAFFFLHPMEVKNCFLDLMSKIPEEKYMQLFADYLFDNFISEDSVLFFFSTRG